VRSTQANKLLYVHTHHMHHITLAKNIQAHWRRPTKMLLSTQLLTACHKSVPSLCPRLASRVVMRAPNLGEMGS